MVNDDDVDEMKLQSTSTPPSIKSGDVMRAGVKTTKRRRSSSTCPAHSRPAVKRRKRVTVTKPAVLSDSKDELVDEKPSTAQLTLDEQEQDVDNDSDQEITSDDEVEELLVKNLRNRTIEVPPTAHKVTKLTRRARSISAHPTPQLTPAKVNGAPKVNVKMTDVQAQVSIPTPPASMRPKQKAFAFQPSSVPPDTPKKRQLPATEEVQERQEEQEEPELEPEPEPETEPGPEPLPRTPSPHKAQQRLGSSTTRRMSDRRLGLPPSKKVTENAPANLTSRLEGYHMDRKYGGSITPSKKRNRSDEFEERQIQRRDTEDSDDDDNDAEADVSDLEVEGQPKQLFVSRSTQSTTLHTARPAHRSRRHATSHVLDLCASVTSVLTGARLPGLEHPASETTDAMQWPYLGEQYQKWEQSMRYAAKSVIENGVGNCLMLLGPRGVGKTMLTERCLSILDKVYGRERYIPVRLNGLIHTTDRMALRSIAWQLKTHGFDEYEGDWSSNAATMTTLLRMLEPATDPNSVTEKPVIIVLDEFDLFALHPRQSFLYCLLDIVQGNRRKAGMGVFGLSARADCLSILEKRVRSRCQSQVHHMVLSNNFADYVCLAKSLLRVDEKVWGKRGAEQSLVAREWNEEVEAFTNEAKVQEYLKRSWFTYGNTPTQLRIALTQVMQKIEGGARRSLFSDEDEGEMTFPTLDCNYLPIETADASRDDLSLDRLSVLELTVCVAAKHMRIQHDNTINLEMLYRCYMEHVGRTKNQVSSKPFSRAAFAMAFDTLRAQQLFLPHLGKLSAAHISPSESNPHKTFRFVPWDSTIDDALKTRAETKKDVPEKLKKWAKDWVA
ncbi:origin recognition complex subunit 4 [Microbotryomycetes sp. JL221]|nr:origin recognition complex subunit 4 [Microbotryomycetes sp. JL221]